MTNQVETAVPTPAAAAPVPSDARCHIRVVTTNAEFDLLEDQWNRLLDHADATIFQTFEWARTWWKHFSRPADRLHIVLFTCENRLVGIAPLFMARFGIPGLRAFAHLQFIGRGLSDYTEFIVERGCERIVFAAFSRYLLSTARRWDVFDIGDANEKSTMFRELAPMLEGHGIAVYRYLGNVCPWMALPEASDLVLHHVGPTASYNFKRKFKKLQQAFTVDIGLYRHETDDVERGIEEFSFVHGQRWKSQGYPSAFDDPALRAFHTEFSRKFARRGWLRLFVLKVNETPVAVNYGFNYGERIYMYHSNAHGTEEVMKSSPGFLIRSIAMAEGISEGMKIFDFLRGDEAYKYKEWKATDTTNYLIRASSPTLTGRLRFALYLIAELLHKCYTRLQREYYGFRRFRIVQRRSTAELAGYIAARAGDLFVLGFNFIVRYAPFRSIQRLQITRHATEEPAPPSGNGRSGAPQPEQANDAAS